MEQAARRVTIADVAERAGVSKTAVSFAFNNPDRLNSVTASRILDIVHNYVTFMRTDDGTMIKAVP